MQVPWLSLLTVVPALAAFSDPPLLSYATYLGNMGNSIVNGFAVDSAGYAYVSGPAPFTPQDPLSNCGGYLAKLNPTGSTVLWSRCLTFPAGGSIARDSYGSIYVVGNGTNSSTITKLNPDATAILYSTTIAVASAHAIAVDQAESAYVVGSAGPGLPTTPGVFLPQVNACVGHGCTPSPFALKLDSQGAVTYATYLAPGSATAVAYLALGSATAVAVDSQGNAWTAVSWSHFIFVVKVDARGATAATIAGIMSDSVRGLTVDAADSVYVVGQLLIEDEGPSGSGYVNKYTSAGQSVYEKRVGTEYNYVAAIAADAEGNAYFGIGGAQTGCGFDPTQIVILSSDGSSTLATFTLLADTAFGGQIALDGNGGVYVAGTTRTTSLLTTPGAFETKYPGYNGDAFVAKFDLTQPGSVVTGITDAIGRSVGICTALPGEGFIAPGEVVSIVGQNLPQDPAMKITFTDAEGGLWPAPILSAQPNQITVVVPFEVGRPWTMISLQSASRPPIVAEVLVWTAQPVIIGILNQDGTLNSSANPAAAGSIPSLFLTGTGTYNVGIPDGSAGPLLPPYPLLDFSIGAQIWGPNFSIVNGPPYAPGSILQVLYAGQAPGLIAGVAQMNVLLPANAPSGADSICVFVDSSNTCVGIYVSQPLPASSAGLL